jgi:hyperosmotically inducible periplasmic protein
MTRTNEQIKKDIVDELYWDSRVNSSKIKVEVDKNEVKLKGKVPTYWAKRAAEEDAAIIASVLSVNNQLDVKYPAAVTVATDEEIKYNVKQVLLWNPDVDSTNIDVDLDAGIATLKGSVDSFWKKLRAENITADVSGVLAVTNKLAVVPTESYVDESIAKDIVNKIDRNVNIDIKAVDVKVKNGRVTLSGTVDNWSAYNAAYNAASYTAGVTEIKDKIVIK